VPELRVRDGMEGTKRRRKESRNFREEAKRNMFWLTGSEESSNCSDFQGKEKAERG